MMLLAQADILGIRELVIAVGVPAAISLMILMIGLLIARSEFEKVRNSSAETNITSDAQAVVNKSFTTTQDLVNDLNTQIFKILEELNNEKIKTVRLEEQSKARDDKFNELLDTIKKRDETILLRDETIKSRDETIKKLESKIIILEDDRTSLIKQRDALNAKIDALTEEIGKLNARLDLRLTDERQAVTQPIPTALVTPAKNADDNNDTENELKDTA